jgi:hypothetical protein
MWFYDIASNMWTNIPLGPYSILKSTHPNIIYVPLGDDFILYLYATYYQGQYPNAYFYSFSSSNE